VGLVNPWVEADRGRFFFFQAAKTPFGFASPRPDTSTTSSAGSGYTSTQNEVKGFSHVHEWRLSGVQVMPTTGPPVPKLQGDEAWQSKIDHAREVAEPGYQRVHLDRYGITAELTATDRVGLHRYTYDKAGSSEVIVNLAGTLGQATMKDAQVTRVGHRRLVGWVRQSSQGYAGHDTKLYFDLRVDQPFTSLRGWVGDKLSDRPLDTLAGDQLGVYLRYDRVKRLQMKVGLSLTGVEGATRNLEAEAPGWNFDRVRRATQKRWNAMLGRFDVRGGTHQQQVKFYTDLFHVLCGRGVVSDHDGAYLDDTWNAGVVRHGAPSFNYDALWLTQWNVNTVLGLAYPDIYAQFVRSQLQMYRDGGMLPRGPVAGNDSLVMTGSPVTSFIAGAWNKGIRDFDVDTAFDAMLDAQAVGGLFDKAAFEYDGWSGQGGIRDYLDRGFVPADLATGPLGGGAGQTLEYAFQDWTLAQLARQLRKRGINVAQFAKASASSGTAARAIDGRPARSGDVRWTPNDDHPWVRLDWPEPQQLTRVVVTDPGTLRFSDGASLDVEAGTTTVDKRVDWVRFEGPGLGDIEVYDDRDVAAYLEQRARNWRNLFDPSTGFIRPKHRDGTWLEPFDPLAPEDFVEANAWQAGWFTSQDVMGLANLLGGEEVYANKLDFAFESAKDTNFIADYGDGYVSYGNQPGLQMAHLFNYVGYPWLSQYWVRQVKETTYGATSTTDGYGHFDEDQGQMGGMSALMAMGLFEVTGGGRSRPVYDITAPVFREVRVGRDFRIVTHGDLKDPYIQRARLNGRPLDNAWLYADQLHGRLDLWLGPEPNTHWGVAQLPPSDSPSEHRTPVNATSIAISGPDAVHVPYESVDYTAAFTPENASLKAAYWSVTEPDGSPTDKATVSNGGVLTVDRHSGPVRITATAADSGRVTASKLVQLDLDVTLLRANAARWQGVTATASSEFSGFGVSHAIDGFGRDSADWASRGEQNPWVELAWQTPITADRIVLYDRTSHDDAHGGTLVFGDGSSVKVDGLPVDGSPKTITFAARTFDHVRFQVAGGSGANVGLLEFEVYAVPRAPDPPYRVSVDGAKVSWTPPRFDGGAPVTGYRVRGYADGAVVAEKTVEGLQTDMPAAASYRVAALNALGTGEERGTPVFATRIGVSGPDRLGQPDATATYTAAFTPANTTYQDVTWTVTEPDGAPTEKARIGVDGVLRVNTRNGQVRVTATNADGGPEVHGSKLVTIDIDQDAIRENAARRPGVTVTASSVFSSAFGVERVRDGFLAGSGDWASAGEQDPWVELTWPEPIRADRVVLYDRTSNDNANGGTLAFGDGSTLDVTAIPPNGDPKTVTFALKTFDRVRFQVEGGTGPNVGLLELEVYAQPQDRGRR
jgi:putative alpha-1,2-mannosidase